MNTTSTATEAVSHEAQHDTSKGLSSREFLTFRLGREEYGIDILNVQEIRGYSPSTHMANTPAHVLGVVNLRGVIVPIVDLRMKFELEDVVYGDLTVTIVLNIGERVIGIVVDSVSDVIELQASQIQPAPAFSGGIGTDHITGIGTIKSGDEERMLILIDIDQLMSSADMGLVGSVEH
ncbi:MAG: chemotaxis protein CheW [Gammaproteobacteria bacterium]|nr:chemotaxis protein CheW [Gammaproteobacteria bacterium]MBU0788611.1 chemotaxis protein CheW [Gammaproteobacteria bacterium]MBU0814770.1 chemotaxis protein CheW [Gammaproteobacteria bacterium]MBU1786387.1 chemotaxis protein CheW [Gammaproteobacteria bacterium]